MTAQEDILVEGKFSGEVVLMDNALVVGQTGDMRADIKAKNITIHGKANGDVHATDQVEISATGSMRGDILSPRVILPRRCEVQGPHRYGARRHRRTGRQRSDQRKEGGCPSEARQRTSGDERQSRRLPFPGVMFGMMAA